MIETEMVEMLHVILETMCFNVKNIFLNSIEHVSFEILIPKVKPFAIGIFHRPPRENDFFKYIFKRVPAN